MARPASCTPGAGIGLVLLTLAGCGPAGDPDRLPAASLSPTRDYGYVLGDEIHHAITLELAEGQSLERQDLPPNGPLNDWLTLRDSRVQPLDGGARPRVRLDLAYQVFKGVRQPETVAIPPLSLRIAGPPPHELKTPAWSFTLAPVIPPDLPDEQVEVRDPLPPESADTNAAAKPLAGWLTGLASTGGLIGLRQYLRRRRVLPFARASRELRQILASGHDAETLRAAARTLHRALDQTFGETLFSNQLDRFCATCPAFASLRERLAEFLGWSQALFFDPGAPVRLDAETRRWLRDLMERCLSAERRLT